MREVHQFALLGVVFLPVTADGEDNLRGLVDGNDVGTCYTFLVRERLRQVDVHVHLEDSAPRVVLISLRVASELVVLLLDVSEVFLGCGQLDVAVEPNDLQLPDLIVGLLHHMREPRADTQVRRAVRDHEVLSGHKDGDGNLVDGVVVCLLE